jgi:hypothetical protein
MKLNRYGLFQVAHKSFICRDLFNDLEEANIEARKLADQERNVFFIFCFDLREEAARFQPTERRCAPRR